MSKSTSNVRPILTVDDQFEIVVLNADSEALRVIYRSPHYAAALGFLSRNLDRRPNLDMVQNGRFVDWELRPGLLGPVEQAMAEVVAEAEAITTGVGPK